VCVCVIIIILYALKARSRRSLWKCNADLKAFQKYAFSSLYN
jgi:hypothetical protein